MDDNEKWWLEGLTDEQRAATERPGPLPSYYQPYAQPYGQPNAFKPAPTKNLAGWALGLSFVPGFCAPQVLAVAFAIITLVRSAEGRDHGKRRAIAALCVVGAWIVGSLVWVGIDVADELRNGAARKHSGEISFRALGVGDCFEMPEGERVSSVHGVSCEELHDAEVYATFDLRAGEYPGDDVVPSTAEKGCATRFEAFVGKPYGHSQLDVFYLYPTSELWRLGDRGVTCSVYEPTRPSGRGQNQVTGTLRNAGR